MSPAIINDTTKITAPGLMESIRLKDSEKSLDDDFGLGLNLSTPYVQEKNIQSINEAFSLSDSAPWGLKQVGFDFYHSKI